MITIQGFAKLCGCNTQTLRYYDRIGLMKPAKVDEWTGYRYYEEEQALLFVKIKNLQQADFSIEEIKALLPGDDDLLIAALERKIEEQKQKLERIRKIQRSYLQEAMDMRNMVTMLTEFVEGRASDPILWKEFGLDSEAETETRAKVHETIADWLSQCRGASAEIAQQLGGQDLTVMKEVLETLTSGNPEGKSLLVAVEQEGNSSSQEVPPDAEKVYECSGWEHVSEWIRDIPALDSGKQTYCRFRVRKDSPVSDPGFPTLMLAVMDALYGAVQGGMNCTISLSDDGINHFDLLQK